MTCDEENANVYFGLNMKPSNPEIFIIVNTTCKYIIMYISTFVLKISNFWDIADHGYQSEFVFKYINKAAVDCGRRRYFKLWKNEKQWKN